MFRLIHWIANGFWTFLLRRAESAEQARITNLIDRIEEQNRQIEWLREDILAKDKQVQLLTDVITRDRERVKAETAIYSRRLREATSSPSFDPDKPRRP
jgi:hypothetical protein